MELTEGWILAGIVVAFLVFIGIASWRNVRFGVAVLIGVPLAILMMAIGRAFVDHIAPGFFGR